MRRKVRCLLISVFLVLLAALPVQAGGLDAEQASISVSYGIYDEVKAGRYAPVFITVEKTGDFSQGLLRLSVPMSVMAQNVYEQKVQITQGYSQTIGFYIPIYSETSWIKVELLNQDGDLILSHKENLPLQNDAGQVYTGILDRLENDESRLNHLIIDDNSDISIKELHISTDAFPEDVLELHMLDVIIVNPSAEKILTDNKRKILEQWVREGGICILNENEFESCKAYGQGIVYACPQDLFQKEEEEMRAVFLKLMDQDRLNEIQTNMLMGVSDDYFEINNLINNIDSRQTPTLYLYAVLLVIYMALICPFMFIFLRRKRKSIYYGYLVTFCAVFFSFIIFIAGGRTRVYESIINYCKMVYLQGDSIYENSYIGIKSPDNKENQMTVDASYTILPVQNSYENFYFYSGVPREYRDYDLKIQIARDAQQVEIKNKEAFDMSLFRLTKSYENQEQLSIETDLHLFDNRLSGSVTNKTGKDLQDVFIAGFQQFYYIGPLKNGETANISDVEMEYYSAQFFPEVSKSIQSENAGAAYYMVQSSFGDPSSQFIAAGVIEEDPGLFGENHFEIKGTTLVSQQCTINFYQDGQWYTPIMEERPVVISGNYRYKSSIMESESCVVTYNLGDYLLIDYITFYENDCTEEDAAYRQKFSGSAYFMNWDTGEYEAVGDLKGSMTAEQLVHYVNDANQLQVKYVDHAYGDKVYSIGIPFISVTGRQTYAGY